MRLSDRIRKLENFLKTSGKEYRKEVSRLLGILALILYFYGMLIRAIQGEIIGAFSGTDTSGFTLSPLKNIGAVFSPLGLGLPLAVILFLLLFSERGSLWLKRLISGTRSVWDPERKIEILEEGTYGTSGWLTRPEMQDAFEIAPLGQLDLPVIGKLNSAGEDYLGLKSLHGMNKNIMVYGAPGTGKSRGFVSPFILQAAKRGESMIITDAKAELYEKYAHWLGQQGYTVKAFNLLDFENSDAWNVLCDISADRNLVQPVAQIIIDNTSSETEKTGFWTESEKNLLMALLLYVQSLTDPKTGELLPPVERSLGAIYRLLSACPILQIDDLFRRLPADHPALGPYGIFKQAGHQIWGNIAAGLGSRLSVFQNELVDTITKYNEIDLELPGKQKCAYFCILSDQNDSMGFLSSLFFSMLFLRLSDYARKEGVHGKLPVEVNVILDEFSNVGGKLLNFKQTISTVRSRGINCQVIVQSIAQLADRYPKTEWLDIVANCDTQLFLGCNDSMTAKEISDRCGFVTVRTSGSSSRVSSVFSGNTGGPSVSSGSVRRPLMTPDEILRLPKNQALLFVRSLRPARIFKIEPEEHPESGNLVQARASDHIPMWRQEQQEKENRKPAQSYHPSKENEQAESGKKESRENQVLTGKADRRDGIDCETWTEINPDQL